MIADRWGVTDEEVARRYPCDDLVPPGLPAWRGVTVRAPAGAVWPWLVQVRLAPYSYDWVDNLGRRSPRELRGLPDPAVGDPFTASAGRPLGRLLAVEPGRSLTARIAGTVMSYVVVDDPAGSRLLLKLVMPRGLVLRLTAPALSLGDLVMARRQLLNLAHLAETSGDAG